MLTLKNVLVATDFGEASDTALTYGRELCRKLGATLHLLHVVDDIGARLIQSAGIMLANLDRLQTEAEKQAQTELDARLTEEDRCVLQAKTVRLTSSIPAQAIISYARQSKIDLIVMGTHGRSGVVHVLLGSIAEKVVRRAPCPVLTVRNPEREFVLPDALQLAAQS